MYASMHAMDDSTTEESELRKQTWYWLAFLTLPPDVVFFVETGPSISIGISILISKVIVIGKVILIGKSIVIGKGIIIGKCIFMGIG